MANHLQFAAIRQPAQPGKSHPQAPLQTKHLTANWFRSANPAPYLCVPALALAAICAFAAVVGQNVAALPLTEQRIATLPARSKPPGANT